ncbi:hypothetical protein [Ruminococcus flavefaciens]|uniref:hypothetical protein n=1 Tax=Ruminococcus flavefaciens TaxID=1265 RepID=UPI0012BC7A1D|nr:hypothetical protein [Ruminococcus flavefaciens]
MVAENTLSDGLGGRNKANNANVRRIMQIIDIAIFEWYNINITINEQLLGEYDE